MLGNVGPPSRAPTGGGGERGVPLHAGAGLVWRGRPDAIFVRGNQTPHRRQAKTPIIAHDLLELVPSRHMHSTTSEPKSAGYEPFLCMYGEGKSSSGCFSVSRQHLLLGCLEFLIGVCERIVACRTGAAAGLGKQRWDVFMLEKVLLGLSGWGVEGGRVVVEVLGAWRHTGIFFVAS